MRLLICVMMAGLLVGCSANPPDEGVPTGPNGNTPDTSPQVTPGESVPPADSPDTTAVQPDAEVIIDVRSKDEWDGGHLSQAVHIPHTEIAEKIADVTSQKDAKIVLYCASGGRAGRAKEALEEMGYTNVENAGGYDDVKKRYE